MFGFFVVKAEVKMEEKKHHYTYIIINQENGMMYIGTRSCNVNPMFDIGVKYYSSSKDKEFIKDQKENREKYSYQVLRGYKTRKEATNLEIELHELHDVGVNEAFYNRMKQTSRGFDITGNKEIARKIGESGKGNRRINNGKVNKHVDKEKFNGYLNEGWVEGWVNVKYSRSIKGKILINNGIKLKYVGEGELESHFHRGYILGGLKKSSKDYFYSERDKNWVIDRSANNKRYVIHFKTEAEALEMAKIVEREDPEAINYCRKERENPYYFSDTHQKFVVERRVNGKRSSVNLKTEEEAILVVKDFEENGIEALEKYKTKTKGYFFSKARDGWIITKSVDESDISVKFKTEKEAIFALGEFNVGGD